VSQLELAGVDVAYGDLPALTGVDLVVERGETLSVVGANGAGKTTMLRTISGLLRPRRGEVRFEGERIDRLPCHRVVGSTGSLVGYAGGLEVKRRLLAIEGADVARRH